MVDKSTLLFKCALSYFANTNGFDVHLWQLHIFGQANNNTDPEQKEQMQEKDVILSAGIPTKPTAVS